MGISRELKFEGYKAGESIFLSEHRKVCLTAKVIIQKGSEIRMSIQNGALYVPNNHPFCKTYDDLPAKSKLDLDYTYEVLIERAIENNEGFEPMSITYEILDIDHPNFGNIERHTRS